MSQDFIFDFAPYSFNFTSPLPSVLHHSSTLHPRRPHKPIQSHSLEATFPALSANDTCISKTERRGIILHLSILIHALKTEVLWILPLSLDVLCRLQCPKSDQSISFFVNFPLLLNPSLPSRSSQQHILFKCPLPPSMPAATPHRPFLPLSSSSPNPSGCH